MNWIDNRTRALIVEFSVYNAQTEYLTIAKIAAEFVGGGVVTKYRFDPRILFRADTSSFNFNTIVQIAQILFVVRDRPHMTSPPTTCCQFLNLDSLPTPNFLSGKQWFG